MIKFLWNIIKKILILFFGSTILAVVLYRYVPVYVTPLMVIRLVEQHNAGEEYKMKHNWVSLDKISHHMPQAVVASEDNLFMTHHGFDVNRLRKQLKKPSKESDIVEQAPLRNRLLKTCFCGMAEDTSVKDWRLILHYLWNCCGVKNE